jgi:alanine racemase
MEGAALDGLPMGAGLISRTSASPCDEAQHFMLRALPRAPMPRPILATVDLDALRHNLAAARRHAGGRGIWAVVKANAYGHGLQRALRGFADADGLALLDLDEAARARDGGWRKPILLLEGFFASDDLPAVDELRLTTVVHHPAQVQMLAAFAPASPIDVYVKVNSGMNRLGLAPGEVPRVVGQLAALPGVRIAAMMMHFANADRDDADAGPVAVTEQLRVFEEACRGWTGPRCVANSAALFLHPQAGGDSVRPGIARYGATPMAGRAATSLGLRPAMSLTARVLSVQRLAAGASLGYGSRWTAARPSRIGVLACGYADGYPRVAPDGTPVWVGGRRVPLVGRVSMDMITVDLTDAPGVDAGAEAELWGTHIPVDEVAERSGTVGYELLCALAARVPVREIG